MPSTAGKIRKVSGFGGQLRTRLAELRMSQADLANATGLSRQTISRAIRSDEASPVTMTLVDQVLGRNSALSARIPGGNAVEQKQHKPSNLARRSHALTDATDLEAWSDRRDAQEDLPRIVRRLILVTAEGIGSLSFRSGEGIQLPGWDGRVSTSKGTAFVPLGESVWELGTSTDPAAKANSDYKKRTVALESDRAEVTFVFVTSRRWAQKDEWAQSRRAEKVWKDVRVIDGDDLETWLELAPSVHLWLSARIGILSDGAQDLGSWAETWTHATRPPLESAFVSAGRETQVKKIQEWRSGSSDPIAILSESRQESVAVLSAAFQSMPADQANDAMARAIVVHDAAAWRRLIPAKTPLILIPLFDAGDLVAAAIRAGHAVAVPLGEGDVIVGNTISLPSIPRAAATAALVAAGEPDEDRARDLAGVARRSMLALRRRLAVTTSLQKPAWARPEVARLLLPGLFAGSWNDAVLGDREALADIAGKPYDDLARDLSHWASGADPAFRQRQAIWYIVSREDAWDLLGKFVKQDDALRFETTVVDILSAPDPRYDLPTEQRWMAEVYGKKAPHSGILRKGIGATLGLIGARADTAMRSASPGTDAGEGLLRSVTARVIRKVLERANSDWRVWASLSDLLGDLAEADPDAFLSALEIGIEDADAPISRLFTDKDDALFGSSPHTGLLWALERVAWAPDYLSRVVQVLADLATQDPGGKLLNRPAATLHSIFRPWFPQTAASLDKRFKVLDSLVDKHEDLVWEVLISTLPEFHAVASSSARPQWRPWASERTPRVKRSEYDSAIVGAVTRLIELARNNGGRWAALVDALPQLGKTEYDTILDKLSTIALTPLDDATRLAIWTSLRKLIGQHRRFPNADWAMADDRLERLDALRQLFIPTGLLDRFSWLFAWHVDLPNSSAVRDDSQLDNSAEVRAARQDAVRIVENQGGLQKILELAASVEQAQFVGEAAAEAGLFQDIEDQILVNYVGSQEAYEDIFARSYAFTRQRTAGVRWISDAIARLKSKLTAKQQAFLLSTLPPDKNAWQLAASLGEETEREYWGTVQFVSDDTNREYAIKQLLKWGRVARAVDFMGMFAHRGAIDASLVLEGLERLLAGEGRLDELHGSIGYHLGELLDTLARDENVDQSRVARIEWGFLPVLDSHTRHPKTLHRALAEEPRFFVDLISSVFRAEGEPRKSENEITEDDRQRASRAYALLRSWHHTPGTRDDNSVDRSKLSAWIEEARDRLREVGRLPVGDQQIGQMLSGSAPDPDGTWPPLPVRSVIEEIHSEHLEKGFAIGVYNGRGVVTRSLEGGGGQERALAERYDGFAAAVADASPRTAALLRSIARNYRVDAQEEDQRTAIDQDLDF